MINFSHVWNKLTFDWLIRQLKWLVGMTFYSDIISSLYANILRHYNFIVYCFASLFTNFSMRASASCHSSRHLSFFALNTVRRSLFYGVPRIMVLFPCFCHILRRLLKSFLFPHRSHVQNFREHRKFQGDLSYQDF